MHRTESSIRSRHEKLSVYIASATSSAAFAGAVLGLGGSFISIEVRAGVIAVLSVLALGAGILELAGRTLTLLQRDRETPVRWLGSGPLAWAATNGASLGVGVTSRLGFPLWYAIPAGAALCGSAVGGSLLYGLYGFTRSAAAGAILERSGGNLSQAGFRLVRRSNITRRVAAGQLVALGAAACVAVGF